MRDAPDLPPRVHRLILALVFVVTLLAGLGTALSPYLLVQQPLLLIALNPDSRHLVLAAASTDVLAFTLVGVPRRALSFLATYALARRYGHAAITWLEKRHARLSWLIRLVERLYVRLGVWLVVLFPFYFVAGLAGAARLRLSTYVLAMLPGQVVFILAWYHFGAALEAFTTPLVAWLSAHVVEATAVCVTAVVLQQLVSWRRRRRGRPATAGSRPGPN